MYTDYDDIRSQLGEPLWWDEWAVPRYWDFSPRHIADIYANQACLVRIACARCGKQFKVAMSSSSLSVMALQQRIAEKTLYFGDPPNMGCCRAGPTMTSDMLNVIEFWRHNANGTWQRDQSLEVDLPR